MPAYRRVREFSKTDPVLTALYRNTFDRGRLKLPTIEPEKLGPSAGSIQLPTNYPLFAGEDAPLEDMLLLLNLAKGRKARRILEIGTYRARTTYALYLNCPEADIVSYDIQVLDSPYRQKLTGLPNVQLRHASFIDSTEALQKEKPYDFIFVDGSHYFEHALADSRLSMKLVSDNGIIVWHDYRPNDYYRNELRVPEALDQLKGVPIFAVPHTMCAVLVPSVVRDV
jgi:predicted O-methyltransferase YrrM